MNVQQKALKLLEQEDWDAAHRTIQEESDSLSCLIHGLLHRLDGDLPNAAYWYRRAGESLSELPIEEEVERLTRLAGSPA